MGFFRDVKNSFTDFQSYKIFAFQKGGKTFKYLLLLFTLVFLIGGIRFVLNFSEGTGQVRQTVEDEVPDFRLENGELSVEGQQPIVLGDDGHTVMIIDTTGQTDETALDSYREGLLIFKDRLISKQDYQQRIIKYSDIPNLTLDKQILIGLLPLLKWLFVLVAVFAFIFKLVWVLITTLILALIGWGISSNFKTKLQFANLWNIAVYAFTLPWLLEMVKNLVYPGLPLFWAIKWGLAIYIAYRGIQAVKDPLLPDGEALDETGKIII